MSKLSRNKGAAFERFVARKLRPIWSGAKRFRQSNTFDNTVDGPDVEAGPFDIECKHRKNVSRPAAIREAKEHARAGKQWATVIREHGQREADVTITLPLDVFVSLLQDVSRNNTTSDPDNDKDRTLAHLIRQHDAIVEARRVLGAAIGQDDEDGDE